MFKILIPILGIIIAVGLFFTYIQPTFSEVRMIQDETAQYAEATEKATELQQRITQLKAQQERISQEDRARLETLLPNVLDEVTLLIDINTLASAHNLILSDIDVGNTEGVDTAVVEQQGATPATADPLREQYVPLDIGFSVAGSYADFRNFLKELERSLVLTEVTQIQFTESEGDLTRFDIVVRFYSLNSPAS